MMNSNDLKVELIYYQTGTTERPGGQQAGVPSSMVRVTHIPTGIMAQCGEATSQHRNKLIATSMVEYALVELGYI
jgi:protein subunit release factor A